MNEETKSMWASKTVWASLVVVIISVLTTFGIISPGEVNQEEATTNVFAIVQGVAGLLAFFGRITAKTKVKVPGTSAILIAFIVFSLLLGGCQDVSVIKSDPRAEVKLTQSTLNELIVYATELKNTGILKSDDLERVRIVANSATVLVADWTEYVKVNNKRPDTADAAIALIDELKQILRNKEKQ